MRRGLPTLPGKKYLDSALADPAGKDVEAVRPIRNEIRTRVEPLITETDAKQGAQAQQPAIES
jgi:hypothetical protein